MCGLTGGGPTQRARSEHNAPLQVVYAIPGVGNTDPTKMSECTHVRVWVLHSVGQPQTPPPLYHVP